MASRSAQDAVDGQLSCAAVELLIAPPHTLTKNTDSSLRNVCFQATPLHSPRHVQEQAVTTGHRRRLRAVTHTYCFLYAAMTTTTRQSGPSCADRDSRSLPSVRQFGEKEVRVGFLCRFLSARRRPLATACLPTPRSGQAGESGPGRTTHDSCQKCVTRISEGPRSFAVPKRFIGSAFTCAMPLVLVESRILEAGPRRRPPGSPSRLVRYLLPRLEGTVRCFVL